MQAFEWSIIAATFCLVLLRLYFRFRQSSLTFFEDGFVLLAWLCFLNQVVMNMELYRMGFFNEQLDTIAVDIHGEVANITAIKLGIGFTFALGFLCISFAIAVVIINYVSSSITTHRIVAVFEQALCLSVVCVLALKGLTPSCGLARRKDGIQMHWHREQRWRCRGARDSDSDTDGGTATCSTEDVTRPPSDATIFGHDDYQYTQYNTNSLKRQVESMMAYEDKIITSPTRAHRSPPKVTCTPIPSCNRQSHDTECQMSNPSSPGYTMSIASIVDFYDLERQLQLDDERRQATNCSPVLERRSSELQYASSISAESLSDSKLSTTL
ncbi:hypothetical protein AA313_de0209051 [Arthrobotrys entomopaga]|nr:hypothetical protein AA313_de0209051 [Arthrobotrys entomopaga]